MGYTLGVISGMQCVGVDGGVMLGMHRGGWGV